MNNFQKPELSEKELSRIQELFVLLKKRTWTKAELVEYFGVNERKIRDMISILSKHRPVIAFSSERGYRVATTAADLEDVQHCWGEIDSRIDELEERKKPLIKFCARVRKNG